MTPSGFHRRLRRLEQAIPAKKARYTIWDVLCGAVSLEDVKPEEIADWDKWKPLFEAAANAEDQRDLIEERIHQLTDPDADR